MSYVVFARKWRPQNFDEIVGQEHITTTLKNAIKQDRVAHAYLFCGPRGIGKTTTARILAKALNCQKGPATEPCNKCSSCLEITESRNIDVIEIDGASNNGVEQVRNIRDNVKFSPQNSKYKIYIIDEVHMLTPEAVNALLKTLEEPPAHVKFIFATTQPNKLLPTILSRCQRFDFKRITLNDLISKLRAITKQEGIKIDDEALFTIAQAAEGSMRDAESILDQLNSFCDRNIDLKKASLVLGIADNQVIFEFADRIINKDTKRCLEIINKLIQDGKDPAQVLSGLILHLRNLLIAKVGSEDLIELTPEWIERIKQQSQALSTEDILYIAYMLTNTQEQLKWAASQKIAFEIALVKLTKRDSILPISEILNRLNKLEDNLTTSGSENKQLGAGNIAVKKPQHVQPVEAMPEKQKAEAHDETLDKITQIWPDLIKRVRDAKISAATCLAEGTPVRLDKDTLVIGFPKGNSFFKESLEANNNKKIIENALFELLKSSLTIKFIDINKEPQSSDANASDETIQQEKTEEEPNNPIVQSALGIFGAKVFKNNQ